MYSKPVVMENLKARHTTFSVEFHFTNNITLLMGDSGRGKTLIFTILQELSAIDKRIVCINIMRMARWENGYEKKVLYGHRPGGGAGKTNEHEGAQAIFIACRKADSLL